MSDIFISYSSQDRTIVKQIADILENKGWSVWWDRKIPIGKKFDTVIENELHQASCVLVVWTKHSIASEWVKNEAAEAAQKGILIPVIIEELELPLAFKRIQSALLIDWHGEPDHPELEILFSSITNILSQSKVHDVSSNVVSGRTKTTASRKKSPVFVRSSESTGRRTSVSGYGIIGGIGFVISLALVYYYLQFVVGKVTDTVDQRLFYLILILFGISASALVFGVMNTYAVLTGKQNNFRLKVVGPGVGVILVVLGGLYLPQKSPEKIVTIRVFDWKKRPVTQGEVKIYLKEYIRTQSIDKMGQALFGGIPSDLAENKMKVEVSSPGYATQVYDTLLKSSEPLELILPLNTVVNISGKVKTAAEMPIKGVEINVDGTRYYAISTTDGSYKLRLEEYTLGDEITLTTSHKKYEDKTFSMKINSPEITNQDIFLNPVSH
jgi:hypothetical protein